MNTACIVCDDQSVAEAVLAYINVSISLQLELPSLSPTPQTSADAANVGKPHGNGRS